MCNNDKYKKAQNDLAHLQMTLFNMLNHANMYVLVLDDVMNVKYANHSLVIDLGLTESHEIINRCWLDFIQEKDQEKMSTIHSIVSKHKDLAYKYSEVVNNIYGINGQKLNVHWFNSNINSNLNWSFSFGLRKYPVTEVTAESIRGYYRQIIDSDKTMINSLRDMILLKEKPKTCEIKNEEHISV